VSIASDQGLFRSILLQLLADVPEDAPPLADRSTKHFRQRRESCTRNGGSRIRFEPEDEPRRSSAEPKGAI